MARDGVFLRAVGRVHPRSQVPILAIALQCAAATVIALTGRYDQILSYVVSVDFLFFGATAASLFVFRRREPDAPGFRAPGHPWTTSQFVLACALVVVATVTSSPRNTAVGIGILLSGIPIYVVWRRTSR
jgi:APA family basic amino acid/polyamine antiporter